MVSGSKPDGAIVNKKPLNQALPIGTAAISLAIGMGLQFWTGPAAAGDDLWEAISTGKPSLSMRYRFEYVDDDEPRRPKDAIANTLRTALGYKTGQFYGFDVLLEAENVLSITDDDYQVPGIPSNTEYAVIADPTGTEMNQAYLGFAGIANTYIQAGRQIVTYRDAPFHRYLGTVLWRQNWQTHDGVGITNTSFKDLRLRYNYTTKVHRIFGEDSAIGESPMDSHFINVLYTGIAGAELEGYFYRTDYDGVSRFDAQTIGVRLQGAYKVNDQLKWLYHIEGAYQDSIEENPADYDTNYFKIEGGLNYALGNAFIKAITIKLAYELLTSDDGIESFQTPLATLHAFHGWADKLLTYPRDGIEDIHITFAAPLYGGVNLLIVYYDIGSDNDDYDYAQEFDIQLTKKIAERFTFGLKYANWDSDQNLLNLARNGTLGYDTSKTWAFVQFQY
jgi:hypothetical protein